MPPCKRRSGILISRNMAWLKGCSGKPAWIIPKAWMPGWVWRHPTLKRFDLASNAYRQAEKIGGITPTILNNWGYSYLLRGNVIEARKKLLAAYQLEPGNKAVNANLELLNEGIKRNRAKRT